MRKLRSDSCQGLGRSLSFRSRNIAVAIFFDAHAYFGALHYQFVDSDFPVQNESTVMPTDVVRVEQRSFAGVSRPCSVRLSISSRMRSAWI